MHLDFMNNDVTRRVRMENSGLSGHGGKIIQHRHCLAECDAVLCCLLEVVQANDDPSSFRNSRTGLQRFDCPKISNGNRPLCSLHFPGGRETYMNQLQHLNVPKPTPTNYRLTITG
jgi:hypothetical protein